MRTKVLRKETEPIVVGSYTKYDCVDVEVASLNEDGTVNLKRVYVNDSNGCRAAIQEYQNVKTTGLRFYTWGHNFIVSSNFIELEQICENKVYFDDRDRKLANKGKLHECSQFFKDFCVIGEDGTIMKSFCVQIFRRPITLNKNYIIEIRPTIYNADYDLDNSKFLNKEPESGVQCTMIKVNDGSKYGYSLYVDESYDTVRELI